MTKLFEDVLKEGFIGSFISKVPTPKTKGEFLDIISNLVSELETQKGYLVGDKETNVIAKKVASELGCEEFYDGGIAGVNWRRNRLTEKFDSILQETYKKYSKDKYETSLFDLADEMPAKEVPGSGYVGISSDNDIDNEQSITWYYYDGSDSVDKDRHGGDTVEWYKGLLYCDEYGNIAPPAKQRKRLNRKTGKEEVVGVGMQVDAGDIVLHVSENIDLDEEHYSKLSKKKREEGGHNRYITHGPAGKTGAHQRRIEKRAAAKANQDRIQRWEDRGTMYSPWLSGAPKGWPEDFYKMVQEYTSYYNEGKITKDEIYSAADQAGVDRDEVDQYLSEKGSAFSEAYANSIRANN
jgi:hypothetical protein